MRYFPVCIFLLFLLPINSRPFVEGKLEQFFSMNPTVRIGIVQHFGKDTEKNTEKELAIKPVNANSELEVSVIFQDGERESFLAKDLSLSVEQARLNPEKTEEKTEELTDKKITTVIAGSYRTYEQAYHWSKVLEERFPDNKWTVVFADPWQVSTDLNSLSQVKELTSELEEESFSPKVQEKELGGKLLTCDLTLTNGDSKKIKNIIKLDFQVKDNNSSIKIGEYHYPGSIEVIKDSLGTYSVINIVRIEDYLRGVVPFEIGADAPLSALEVQAILARTYTLANMNRFLPDGYNLCATQHCQVYRGLSRTNSNIDLAIQNTSGIILKNTTGQVAQVFYYSSDGGHSANFSDVWPSNNGEKFNALRGTFTCSKLPKIFNLSDESDVRTFLTSSEISSWGCNDQVSQNKRFRWEKKLSKAELTQSMTKAKDRFGFNWKDFDQVESLFVLERSSSGRILKLLVKTNTGEFVLKLDEMRAALGGLNSTFFVIDSDGKNFLFRGAGFGHGVGLSQFGARNLAEKGISRNEILKAYFPKYAI